MKNIIPIFIIIFIIISSFGTGCIDDSFEQEAAFKDAVDTLYNRGINQFNKELDSICAVQKDSLVLYNMDSIKNLRLKEIENLKKK